jgi:hypothetical protein
MDSVGLGFRVRSGRAIAVLVSGPRDAPAVVDCQEIALADPAVPASIQPYHAALEQHRLTNLDAAARLVRIVERATDRSVSTLLAEYETLAAVPGTCRLVVGSLIDPAMVANQHMRAHALEGQLFRVTLASTLTARGLHVTPMLERSAYAEGARALSRTPDDLKRAIAEMGKRLRGPWRADEKLATLAAWVSLDER